MAESKVNILDKNELITIVPVRAGSRKLPEKNVRLFSGLPLYEHAVRQGLRTTGNCVISTDIEEILKTEFADDRVVYRRPDDLASDHAPMDSVLLDTIRNQSLQDKIVVLLQATSPLRLDTDILAAIELYKSSDFNLVMSVTTHDKSILKFGTLEGGRFKPVSHARYCFSNRQQLPEVYRPNGAIYIFSASWFLKNGQLATDQIGAFEMPGDRSLDVDTLEDFISTEMKFLAAQDGQPRESTRS